ncbi:MAG: hypothetical protein V4644_03540 [Patescibacteria group bacterium]
MRLFAGILDFLFPMRDREAMVRAASVESLGSAVAPCIRAPDVVSLLPYRVPLVQACVTEAKFRKSEHAERLLARVLRDYLDAWMLDRAPFESGAVTLVPVPLSQARLRARGYNQSERIAHLAVQGTAGLAVDAGLLMRVRDTLPQTSLSGDARRTNVKEAFRAARLADPHHTYIVFDDVLTTGSTLNAAVSALKEAGAARVYGLSLAH